MTISEFVNKVGFTVKTEDVQKVNRTITDIKSTATKLLGAIGIGISLTSLNAVAEEFNGINDKINYAVKGLADEKETQQAILKAANDTKSSYESMADTVTDLVKAGSDLFSVDEAVAFSSAVTKMLKTAGRGEGEIKSVMDGLNKSFQKGTVEAETLNVMLEQCPEAANMLADSLGVAKTSLLTMASNGQISCQQLKEAFLGASGEIDAAFDNLDFSISDALLNIRNQWGYWVDDLNSTLGITRSIAKLMVSGFNQVMGVLNKVRNGVVWLSEKLGGAENLMKLVAVAGGTLYAAMNFDKIKAGLTMVTNLLKGVKLSTVAITAAVVLLVLLVDDFINFMQGNDSLMGAMLEKSGVDCDALREKIRTTWDNIRKVFKTAGAAIKNIAGGIFSAVGKIWEQYGGIITNKVAGVITGLVDKLGAFSEWLVEHKDTVVQFGGKIAGLIAVLLKVNSVVKKFTAVSETGKTAKKAASYFSGLKTVVSKLGSAFGALPGPVKIVIIVIAALLAIAYDFFNFMTGKDSVIGKIFDKIGVDSDAVRQKVTEAWQKVKDVLMNVWNAIKSAAGEIWDGLKAFWEKHGEQIKRSFENIWTGIKNIILPIWDAIKAALETVWNVIKTVAEMVFNGLKAFWETWGGTIKTAFSGVWETIKTIFGTVFDVLADIFAIFSDLFSGDWESLWEDVKQLFSDIWDGIVNIFTSIWETISGVASGIWSTISETFSGIFDTVSEKVNSIWDTITTVFTNIWDSITETVTGIKDSIVDGFQEAIDWITSLPGQALQWGKDIINSIVDGIKSAVGKVKEAVSGVADDIKSFLGFSEPETGPLSDFHTYMPDMIDLMASGIEAGKSRISSAVGKLADGMSVGITSEDILTLANAGTASPVTAAAVAGDTISKNITQNVEINNQFNGDRAGQRQSAAAMNSAAADCTSELARALTYSR